MKECSTQNWHFSSSKAKSDMPISITGADYKCKMIETFSGFCVINNLDIENIQLIVASVRPKTVYWKSKLQSGSEECLGKQEEKQAAPGTRAQLPYWREDRHYWTSAWFVSARIPAPRMKEAQKNRNRIEFRLMESGKGHGKRVNEKFQAFFLSFYLWRSETDRKNIIKVNSDAKWREKEKEKARGRALNSRDVFVFEIRHGWINEANGKRGDEIENGTGNRW